MRKLEEKFRENTTLKYYNENATIFSATTQIVDFSITQDKFLALLQPNAYILDFGCGSGRDTKYFMEHGYRVEATDGSEELCKLASTYTGVSVKYMLFQELDEQKKYDGIWAFKTRYGTIGVGICWDQWFPETARGMALKGAELLFYPTAIGSEPILGCDSMPHWRRCMMGHAACNLMPVIAANRIGTETVEPCAENGQQSSALTFYGSSFITDATGEVTEEMDRVSEGFILHTFDLDEIEEERRSWGLFRDRRPEIYLKE